MASGQYSSSVITLVGIKDFKIYSQIVTRVDICRAANYSTKVPRASISFPDHFRHFCRFCPKCCVSNFKGELTDMLYTILIRIPSTNAKSYSSHPRIALTRTLWLRRTLIHMAPFQGDSWYEYRIEYKIADIPREIDGTIEVNEEKGWSELLNGGREPTTVHIVSAIFDHKSKLLYILLRDNKELAHVLYDTDEEAPVVCEIFKFNGINDGTFRFERSFNVDEHFARSTWTFDSYRNVAYFQYEHGTHKIPRLSSVSFDHLITLLAGDHSFANFITEIHPLNRHGLIHVDGGLVHYNLDGAPTFISMLPLYDKVLRGCLEQFLLNTDSAFSLTSLDWCQYSDLRNVIECKKENLKRELEAHKAAALARMHQKWRQRMELLKSYSPIQYFITKLLSR
ncbi:hypothetical protein DdX_10399 [Ditylenchus destructor]|uniref:Uncharacterized protein n=1 Tax=Ditylenchus destructor TaxID=166010 RepID=A0AAD4R5N3_9BILA|nr:hypothetical protein DdX_10399 [Ditylenchus destructor]